MTKARHIFIWICTFCLPAANATSQYTGTKTTEVPAASEVQTTIKEWVKTKQLLSQEKTAWAVDKETLTELNTIRLQEIEQLNEYTDAAGTRVEEITQQRQQFQTEEAELKVWRRNLETETSALEKELLPLIPLFPAPLRAKVEEAVLRIESLDSERTLQHRTRDVLLVMQAYLNFQSTVTLDADIRPIAGEDREVEILYLGLTQAWFVDQTGKHSGFGMPTASGWQWIDDPRIAVQVRQAIDVQSRRATPAFVTLPLLNSGTAATQEGTK